MIFRSASLMQTYSDLFVNRSDVWYRQWVDREGVARYYCVKPEDKQYEPVSLDLIKRHTQGSVTASWPAISLDGNCKWAAWDSDTENGALFKVQEVLKSIGFAPLIESRREGRDGHLWLFFDQPVQAESLIRFQQEIEAQARISAKDLEFFPRTAKGLSTLRGPLGVNLKPAAQGAVGWFDGAPLIVNDQIEWLLNQPRSSAEKLLRIAELLSKQDKARNLARPKASPAIRNYTPGRNILKMVLEKRWNGKDWVAQCPLCADEGHDRHRDNLRITEDGKIFNCVRGGASKSPFKHQAGEIIRALDS